MSPNEEEGCQDKRYYFVMAIAVAEQKIDDERSAIMGLLLVLVLL
jgi:hypothetical protein